VDLIAIGLVLLVGRQRSLLAERYPAPRPREPRGNESQRECCCRPCVAAVPAHQERRDRGRIATPNAIIRGAAARAAARCSPWVHRIPKTCPRSGFGDTTFLDSRSNRDLPLDRALRTFRASRGLNAFASAHPQVHCALNVRLWREYAHSQPGRVRAAHRSPRYDDAAGTRCEARDSRMRAATMAR
jgi:hypothetical protein